MDNDQGITPDSLEDVDTLVRAAFESSDECDLIHRLRKDNDMANEIVLRGKEGLLGYAAISRMVAPNGWLCLAPLAVAPGAQGRGHGTTVVGMVSKWAADRDATVVVLGDPDYYGARGFSAKRAAQLTTRYPVEYTLLAGPGDDAPQETLIYPPAFDRLS